jgi:molybdate transport system substrate-binding protein
LGFVAASQVIDSGGSSWLVPAELHQPIRQDAVLLQRAADSAAARDFLHFVAGEQARSIIQAHGYEAPVALAE